MIGAVEMVHLPVLGPWGLFSREENHFHVIFSHFPFTRSFSQFLSLRKFIQSTGEVADHVGPSFGHSPFEKDHFLNLF